ncbi:hypothetical protein [Kineosporia sp. A_224]|uniref:hypothetical protein n=1 Tax=Kineosporia sp. A_224 TaxID=1962180 RepID=UPI000B4A5888|nr:hypothetical protein [Kineosporia sp. A_224]
MSNAPARTTTRTLRVPSLLAAAVSGVAAVALLAACGGGSTATTTAAAGSTTASGPRTVTATDAAAAPGQGGAGDRGADFQKIQQCLAAAGISLPTPSGMPSGAPTGNGTPPAGGPGGGVTQGADGKFTAPDGDVITAMPTPGADGGPGGGPGMGQLFDDPATKAALEACGISVPTGRPTAAPTS